MYKYILSLLFVFNHLSIVNSFSILQHKKDSMIEITNDIDYETIWDAGEVEWEFAKKDNYIFPNVLEYNDGTTYLTKPNSNTYINVNIHNHYYENSEKNTMTLLEDDYIHSVVMNAVISGLGKALYNEFVRTESVLIEMNDLLYDNFSGNNINNDLSVFLLSIILSIQFYSKKQDVPSFFTKNNDKEKNIKNVKEYIKIRKTATILFLIFFAIFTKNVPHVD